jgi:uncharacterized protein
VARLAQTLGDTKIQEKREMNSGDTTLPFGQTYIQQGFERKYLTTLRQLLTIHFGLSELQTLCFDLGIDYESLPGEGKADKIRELIIYLERRGRILDIIRIGKQLRVDVTFDEVEEGVSRSHSLLGYITRIINAGVNPPSGQTSAKVIMSAGHFIINVFLIIISVVIIIFLVPLYILLYLSEHIGTCRYNPTCRQYLVQAIEIWGLFKGTMMGLNRFGRCHPLGGKGDDPVPLPQSS